MKKWEGLAVSKINENSSVSAPTSFMVFNIFKEGLLGSCGGFTGFTLMMAEVPHTTGKDSAELQPLRDPSRRIQQQRPYRLNPETSLYVAG
ncbi:hypothetical protein OUZ56_023168 [Daphnia magna]|uniref:Uncharacterized protein n=1 Tax=Daphnia magna TaxID=35525 RepID=A0ABR0AYH0_9CRUS|nr:hypothetical protein OUZ56_023168 [Daphnia magna]